MSVSVCQLLDSESAGNFISQSVVSSLFIPVSKLAIPITVNAPNGHPVFESPVTGITVHVHLTFHNHTELIQFLVLPKSQPQFVLGLPWLHKHNPHIDCHSGKILSWVQTCTHTCMPPTLPMQTTSIESPLAHLPVNIPTEYEAFAEIFSATRAAWLPPHRLWECTIDLLPGKTPPQLRV